MAGSPPCCRPPLDVSDQREGAGVVSGECGTDPGVLKGLEITEARNKSRAIRAGAKA